MNENQTIVVEDLAIKNMVKNHKLAQSISDASWGELIRQLAYKCQWYGRTFIKIYRWFPSSKRCGNCGHIVDKMPLDVREWDCPKCQVSHDRDINASKNILAAGLAVEGARCGGPPRCSDSRSVCGAFAKHARSAYVRPDGHKSKGQLRNTRKGQNQKPKS